jgi:hypothetical protein
MGRRFESCRAHHITRWNVCTYSNSLRLTQVRISACVPSHSSKSLQKLGRPLDG